MVVVTPLHAHYSPAHLDHVVAQMRRLGPPKIRAYFDTVSRAWMAQEGTHRLRAAKLLDIPPVMVPVHWPRSRKALDRARFAARLRGHAFKSVDVAKHVEALIEHEGTNAIGHILYPDRRTADEETK